MNYSPFYCQLKPQFNTLAPTPSLYPSVLTDSQFQNCSPVLGELRKAVRGINRRAIQVPQAEGRVQVESGKMKDESCSCNFDGAGSNRSQVALPPLRQ